MRHALLPSLVLVAFLACSSGSPSSAVPAEAGGVVDDGSTEGCTSVGGICEPYAAGCPVLRQNPVFCGNVILVCCLPPGGATVGGRPDAGGPPVALPDGGQPDSGAPDGGQVPDGGMTTPRMDAGSESLADAATNPKDARPD